MAEVKEYFADTAAQMPLDAFETQVCKGDLLLIPPYWYHQVMTLSDSISINAWSSAPDHEIILDVYEMPVSFAGVKKIIRSSC